MREYIRKIIKLEKIFHSRNKERAKEEHPVSQSVDAVIWLLYPPIPSQYGGIAPVAAICFLLLNNHTELLIDLYEFVHIECAYLFFSFCYALDRMNCSIVETTLTSLDRKPISSSVSTSLSRPPSFSSCCSVASKRPFLVTASLYSVSVSGCDSAGLFI